MNRSLPKNSGIALVIVLCFLVLMTVFAVAFFTSVTTDSQGSSVYAKNVQAQQLAQSAVSIAMGQIKDATTQTSGVTWVSQPGLIRTFDSNGQPVNSYRLYSTSNMKLAGSVNPATEVGVVQRKEWSEYPAHMVDLNRPERDEKDNLVYPILDPRAEEEGPNQIQGFTFDTSVMGSKFITETNPAPMPVRWFYVLAKGDIVTGSETDRTTATFENASKENPVVGRIAFWTDDDSSKININTAAGDEWDPAPLSYGKPAGSYWDAPRTYSLFDRQALANYQPAQGEYQRYPGHPATTYLSAVFPDLTSKQIGSITSRIQRGGSLGGSALATGKVVPDADRLYASIDELLFTPDREEQPVTKERLERGRFFLTAHSRAPEANLFNMPRIAIWPIHRSDSNTTRTAYDRLIAFCSTITAGTGPAAIKYPYYFDRANADSTTADYVGRNVQLHGYLQKLMNEKIPGYGGNFTTKYGAASRDQLITEVLDYIRSTNLFDDTLEPTPMSYPTSGGQFTNRRTSQTGVESGHGQVTPLQIDTPAAQTMGFGRFYTISEAGLHFICTADPSVPASNSVSSNKTLIAPLPAGKRRIEAILLLEFFSPSQGWTGIVPDMQVRVRGLNAFRVNGTSLGFPGDATMRMTQSGTSTYHGRAWGGAAGVRFQVARRKTPARGPVPADPGLTVNNSYPFISIPITVDVLGNGTMAFTGGSLTIDLHSGATATQSPGNLVQSIQLELPSGTFPIPTIVNYGTPQQDATPPADPPASATSMQDWWSFSSGAISGGNGRMYPAWRAPGQDDAPREGALIMKEDVVRTVQVSHGDYRMIAARRTVPKSFFAKHRWYDNTGIKQAHSFAEAIGLKYLQNADTGGKLVSAASYGWSQYPDIPEASAIDANSKIRLSRGDWDTGMTTIMDGPYINKPDEGNNYRGTGGVQLPYFDNNQAQEAGGETFFSPNRQMPSPVMFGSLPTGMFMEGTGRSWQTLLFRPDTEAATSGAHIGSTSPKDHLLLDLFWMPVVEPYAISEPFSTAGKVNLNSQIVPFTYFKRTTALRALLKSERVTAIPTSDAGTYKSGSAGVYRHPINADETLKQLETRFAANKPFRSASEICELYLVPDVSGAPSISGMSSYWSARRLTGDNLRERPYATLYPRLTTKSNVYSVHVYVQTLKQLPRKDSDGWKTWDEKKDVVTGEYRGTTVIERYIDLEDPRVPDFATLPPGENPTLDSFTKLRVITNRKFAP